MLMADSLRELRTAVREWECWISNLTCILKWYIILQSLNEINASLQKLLRGNCDKTATAEGVCYATQVTQKRVIIENIMTRENLQV